MADIDGRALGQQNVMALRKLSLQYFRYVNKILLERFGRSWHRPPSRTDCYRLMKLRTWSRKYRVELTLILDILVPIWAGKHGNDATSMGCKANVLVGPRSEQILKQQLLKRYPGGDYEEAWWARRRQLYMREPSVVKRTKANPVQYIREYRTETLRRRKVAHKNMTDIYKRRRYPENPWL